MAIKSTDLPIISFYNRDLIAAIVHLLHWLTSATTIIHISRMTIKHDNEKWIIDVL